MPKRENSHFREKVHLREIAASEACDGLPSVLDLFAAKGLIWQRIPHASYLGCERDRKKVTGPGVLVGDNMKYIPVMDMSGFDVIDADAYGIPADQLLAIIENGSYRCGAAIAYTCIFQPNTPMPHSLARFVGLDEIVSESPAITAKLIEEAFDALLAEFGDERKEYRIEDGSMTKKYGFVLINRKKKC